MLKIGLTGGIGSGKSTASSIMKEFGAYVFDADMEARKILETNEIVQKELIAEFGSDILDPNNEIARKKLARVSFQDEENQSRLNAVIHPHIFEKIDERFSKISKQEDKYRFFVLDGALIYESGADTHMDYVIVITSKLSHRLARIMERGTMTRDDFFKRKDLQWSDVEKTHLADFVVKNDSTFEELQMSISDILNQII